MTLYQLAIIGSPPPNSEGFLTTKIKEMVEPFGLMLGEEITLTIGGADFQPDPRYSAAVVYFGGMSPSDTGLAALIGLGVPIVPVVSNLRRFSAEIPACLHHLNGMVWSGQDEDIRQLAATVLECLGLMPRQRRVFLSYRRDEATAVALQLFEALSKRHFDVFLDTHGVPPAVDFQEVLWHRLCDSDVLIMLDTSSYFASRWTEAEFGSALAKGIGILRIGWPNVTPHRRVGCICALPLTEADFTTSGGQLTDATLQRLCAELETVRSKSIAIRHDEMVGAIRQAMLKLGGDIIAVGARRSILLRLPDDRVVAAYPAVGVPTAQTLHDACLVDSRYPAAVIYDDAGLNRKTQDHLQWLGDHVRSARWIKSGQAAWDFAQWGKV